MPRIRLIPLLILVLSACADTDVTGPARLPGGDVVRPSVINHQVFPFSVSVDVCGEVVLFNGELRVIETITTSPSGVSTFTSGSHAAATGVGATSGATYRFNYNTFVLSHSDPKNSILIDRENSRSIGSGDAPNRQFRGSFIFFIQDGQLKMVISVFDTDCR